MGSFDSIDPVAALARTNDDENRDVQPNDHNAFAATLEALRQAGITVEAALDALDASTAAALDAMGTTVASKVSMAPSFASIAEVYAGMRIPPRSLTRILNSAKPIKRVLTVGDSQTQGNTPGPSSGTNWGLNGPGCWSELLCSGLQSLLGPCLSRGFRGFWTGEWGVTGSWAPAQLTDGFDKGPWGWTYVHPAGVGAITDYATWTPPAGVPLPFSKVVGFEIFWVDAPGMGGTFSISVDGAAFADMPMVRNGGNALKSYYTAKTVTSNVRIRPATAAGVQTGAVIVGIRPWLADPKTATSGFVVDNCGFSAKTLYEFTRAGSAGDPWAIIDGPAVRADTLGAIPSLPTNADLLICGFSNDAVSSIPGVGGNVALFKNELAALYTRQNPNGDLLLWAPYERAFVDQTAQATFRQAIHDQSALFGVPSIDFYEAWAVGLGTAGWTAANGAGLMDPPTSGYAHAGPKGHADQASRFRKLIQLAA